MAAVCGHPHLMFTLVPSVHLPKVSMERMNTIADIHFNSFLFFVPEVSRSTKEKSRQILQQIPQFRKWKWSIRISARKPHPESHGRRMENTADGTCSFSSLRYRSKNPTPVCASFEWLLTSLWVSVLPDWGKLNVTGVSDGRRRWQCSCWWNNENIWRNQTRVVAGRWVFVLQ